MSCLDDSTIVRFIAGGLDEPARRGAEAEIGRCRSCAALVAAVVRGSVALHSEPGGAAATPAAADELVDGADDDAPGGRYVIGAEIARGGMGIIAAAFDRRLGRSIAIKRLERGDSALARRFAREIRVTASLQHPGIVPIYDSGTLPDGQPFYAMRHVPGASLEQSIAGCRSERERLGLLPSVLAAAEAVGYAHERGIIHRDLKPSNVLVGPFGETVVIDWGLARVGAAERDEPPLSEPSLDPVLTSAGSVLGTPRYMSPEQARGEPATRQSDVYSIGAILYHALSGQPPVAGDDVAAILERLARGEIRRLAGVAPRLPGDLVAIVERAMAAGAGARYASAGELAADLRRFQTGQMVAAYAYSRGDLVRRFVRRHRGAVALAAVFAAVVGVGAALGVQRIVNEREHAEAQRGRAEQERAGAEDLVNFLLHDLRKKLAAVGRLDALTGVADRVDAYYMTTARGAAERPETLRERAALWDLRAAVARSAGDGDAVGRYVERGLELVERTPPGVRTEEIRAALLASKAARMEELSRFEPARALHLEAAELFGRIPPDSPEARRTRDLGRALRLMGAAGNSDRLARQADAEREYAEAIDLLVRRERDAPGDLEVAAALGDARLSLGQHRFVHGRLDEANGVLEATIAGAVVLDAREPNNSHHRRLLAWSHLTLAGIKAAQGKLPEAERLREHARDVARAMVALEPASAIWQELVARADADLGAMAVARSSWAAAVPHLSGARTAYAQLVARDPGHRMYRRGAAIAGAQLADAEYELGHVSAARSAWQDALAHLAASGRSNVPQARLEWAYGLRGYAVMERRSGRLAAADQAIAQAVALVDDTPDVDTRPSNTFYRAAVLAEAGWVHEARGRRRDATTAWSRAAAILRELAGRVPLEPDWADQLRVVEAKLTGGASPGTRPAKS
ncbi:MAG TPA: protein kinase [Kofleriaceae bacterium]|nr:protein kinase [Kofleriaceae bacterium]